MKFLTVIARALAVFGIAVATTASGQEAAETSLATDPTLEAFVDAAVISDMQTYRNPGLTLSIVRDGEVVMVKGYGYADLETKTPVDPYTHMFRIGSVSKPFTYTALMQLVEQGKVDLDADVNDYLTEFKIPEAFGKPVRVRDLLTHRPGFEEAFRGMWAQNPDVFLPLGEWMRTARPERAFAPGETTSYSNYGASLAGYIVQEVTGQLFEEYLEEHIFAPLQMNSTTLRQVLAADHPQAMSEQLRGQVASVYSLTGGFPNKRPFELVIPAPAGSISATSADMARFMLAHLGEGTLGDATILRPETAIQMRERPYPGRPGSDYAHGFRTGTLGGFTTFEHGGATLTSYSGMIMVPELEMGVFVSVNGGQSALSPGQIAERVLLRMMGDQAQAQPEPVELSAEELQQYAGSYMTTRRVFSSFEKIFSAAIGGTSVAVTENGSLLISESEFLPLGDDQFLNRSTGGTVFFLRDDAGDVSAYVSEYGHTTQWRTTNDTNIQVFGMAILLAVLLAITILVSAWFRRSEPKPEANVARYLSRSAVFASLGVLVTTVLVGAFVSQATASGLEVIFNWPISSVPYLIVGILVLLLLSAVFVGLWLYNLKSGEFSIFRKIHYGLFAISLIFFLVQANNWHMIGFNYA